MTMGRNRALAGALIFLAPALALLVAFRLAPVAAVLVGSVDLGSGKFGLDTFAFLLDSDGFRSSLLTTLVFNLVINPVQIGLALAIALVLVDGARWAGLFQTILLLPVAVPLAVSAVIWGVAFRPDDGIVNAILTAAGLPAQPWLASPDQALLSIMILASWVGIGYWTLFLVAGLQQIPKELREAAALDGAGYWRSLVHVRLPLLRRTLAFVLIADTVANVLLFAPIQILTRGGPAGSTDLIMFDVFRNAFVFGDKELASAQTVVLLTLMVVVVAVQFVLLDPDQGERS